MNGGRWGILHIAAEIATFRRDAIFFKVSNIAEIHVVYVLTCDRMHGMRQRGRDSNTEICVGALSKVNNKRYQKPTISYPLVIARCFEYFEKYLKYASLIVYTRIHSHLVAMISDRLFEYRAKLFNSKKI